jgi:HD-like signal output (HDOD) protein
MKAVNNRDLASGDQDPGIFLRKLTMEIAVGDIRLPSFPDIAARVQKVLEDPKSAPAKVAVVVRSEAALAARILRLSNSAFLNPSGEQISDLRVALTRLGVQLVRCTAVSFAVQQMQPGNCEPALKSKLHDLWRDGALVAAIAYVLARETQTANPDEALLTGLMHNIGRLYITLNMPRGADVSHSETWASAVRELHPKIAVSILQHWKFPPTIVAAVGHQNSRDSKLPSGEHGLTDVLIAATELVPGVFNREVLPDIVATAPAFARLKLAAADCKRILSGSAEQIRSLRTSLND